MPPNAPAKLQESQLKCERSELPKIACQLQRSLYGRSRSSITISLHHGEVAEVAHKAPARVFLRKLVGVPGRSVVRMNAGRPRRSCLADERMDARYL